MPWMPPGVMFPVRLHCALFHERRGIDTFPMNRPTPTHIFMAYGALVCHTLPALCRGDPCLPHNQSFEP